MNYAKRPWREALKPEEAAEIARLDQIIEHHEERRTAAARERHKIQCRATQRCVQRSETKAIHGRRYSNG